MLKLKALMGSIAVIIVFQLSFITNAFSAFPDRPVTIICPFGAGGSTDLIIRGMAETFKEVTGQELIVINKPGGGSAVAVSSALTYKPDGYTLIMMPSATAVTTALGMIPFDYKKFDLIANVAWFPLCVVVRGDSQWNTMEDFIAYTKENPGTVTVGISGAGTLGHMTVLGLEKVAGIKVNAVPFGGNAPAKAAMLGGHVSAVTMHPTEFVSQYQAGEVKVLTVVTDQRYDYIPDVRTLKEVGYDFAWDDSRWVAAPKGLPEDVKASLAETFEKITSSQSFIDFSKKMKFAIKYLAGDDLEKQTKELYENIARAAADLKK